MARICPHQLLVLLSLVSSSCSFLARSAQAQNRHGSFRSRLSKLKNAESEVVNFFKLLRNTRESNIGEIRTREPGSDCENDCALLSNTNDVVDLPENPFTWHGSEFNGEGFVQSSHSHSQNRGRFETSGNGQKMWPDNNDALRYVRNLLAEESPETLDDDMGRIPWQADLSETLDDDMGRIPWQADLSETLDDDMGRIPWQADLSETLDDDMGRIPWQADLSETLDDDMGRIPWQADLSETLDDDMGRIPWQADLSEKRTDQRKPESVSMAARISNDDINSLQVRSEQSPQFDLTLPLQFKQLLKDDVSDLNIKKDEERNSQLFGEFFDFRGSSLESFNGKNVEKRTFTDDGINKYNKRRIAGSTSMSFSTSTDDDNWKRQRRDYLYRKSRPYFPRDSRSASSDPFQTRGYTDSSADEGEREAVMNTGEEMEEDLSVLQKLQELQRSLGEAEGDADLESELSSWSAEDDSLSVAKRFRVPLHKKVFVYGHDDRLKVFLPQMRKFPFSNIARLSTGCTGTLVTPRHVLTAAHCVHNGLEFRANLEKLKIEIPDTMGFKDYYAQKITVPTGWLRSQHSTLWNGQSGKRAVYDYAVVRLKLAVAGRTRFLPLAVPRPEVLHMDFHFLAFPEDDQQLWRSVCPASKHMALGDGNLIMTRCDAAVGNSGAAVFIKDPHGGMRVVGILSNTMHVAHHRSFDPYSIVTALTWPKLNDICRELGYLGRRFNVCPPAGYRRRSPSPPAKVKAIPFFGKRTSWGRPVPREEVLL